MSIAETRSQRSLGAVGLNQLTCTTCGKVYSRVDHLERHALTHSGEKPYACSECGKSFARQDALKRHFVNHDTPGGIKRKSIQDTRPRTSRACQACAAAKLKCDDRKPCRRCRHKDISCIYNANESPSRHPLSETLIGSTNGRARTYSNSAAIDVEDPLGSFTPLEFRAHENEIAPHRRSLDFPQHLEAIPLPLSNPTAMSVPTGENDQAFEMDPSFMDVFDESSLAGFLNDVMLPLSPSFEIDMLADKQNSQAFTQRNFLDFGTTWDDFNRLETFVSEPNVDVPSQSHNGTLEPPAAPQGTRTPIFDETFGARNAALSQSIWRWVPTKKDRAAADQLYLSLPSPDIESPEARSAAHSFLVDQHIDQSLRDKFLALILSTCDLAIYPEVVSAFPSAELLDGLMHHSLNVHASQADSWIHVPSLRIEESLELLISIVAAGAVTSSVWAIRKLGFALLEAARSAVANKFEYDNRYTRDLGSIQALVLGLQIGLWSGDKRRMEIAESFAQPPITMLRRAGRFSRPREFSSPPSSEDSEEVLKSKWHEWVLAESWKRLAIHLFIHDAQCSMAQQTPPLISPTELTLGLPMSKDLWHAGSPSAWRDIYLQSGALMRNVTPVSQSISYITKIPDQSSLDTALSTLVAIHCVWATVWNNLQLNALIRGSQAGDSLPNALFASTLWENGVSQLLENIRLILLDWNDLFNPEMALVLERTLLNVHVSFEHVQLFAGKEGVEEARRVFPLLRQWSTTSDARKAVWHAGQVLRAAARCASRRLRDFHAVCLYHAGMTLWAYAVLSASPSAHQQSTSRNALHKGTKPGFGSTDLVWLDGGDGPAVQKFITLGRGSPVIYPLGSDSQNQLASPIHLENQKAVMEVCIQLLRQNLPMVDDRSSLPLVENLCQLMSDLGKAAHELLHGSSRRPREAAAFGSGG